MTPKQGNAEKILKSKQKVKQQVIQKIPKETKKLSH